MVVIRLIQHPHTIHHNPCQYLHTQDNVLGTITTYIEREKLYVYATLTVILIINDGDLSVQIANAFSGSYEASIHTNVCPEGKALI